MTPTRALIEAAEAYSAILPRNSDEVEKLKALQAAISSAKAAEEGVETSWRMVNKHRKLGSGPMFETEAAARACFDMPYNYKNYPRLERLDTYSTVIEVREKEGL